MRADEARARASRGQTAGGPPGPVRLLPNAITGVRIALIFVFVAVAEWGVAWVEAGGDPARARWWALGVLLALGASDLVDGWIARRWGLESQLGALLDAVADKLAQVTLLAYFALAAGPPFGRLPVWLLVLLVGRDLFLGGTWAALAARGRRVRVVHRWHGKSASTLVFGLLLWATVGVGQAGLSLAAAVVGVLVAASAVQYLREGWSRLNEESG